MQVVKLFGVFFSFLTKIIEFILVHCVKWNP